MKRLMPSALLLASMVLASNGANAQTTVTPSVIPPIVLQGCNQKVRPRHASIFANRETLSGAATGAKVPGFDLSFVNTTNKIAKIVIVRVGDTDFTKIGTFSPDAVIAWRIAARPGACEVRAVRFQDGSEWSSVQVPSQTPATEIPSPAESSTAPVPAASPTLARSGLSPLHDGARLGANSLMHYLLRHL